MPPALTEPSSTIEAPGTASRDSHPRRPQDKRPPSGEATVSGAPSFEEPPPDQPGWAVCHTKPRCEKRLAQAFSCCQFEHYLPLLVSLRNYGRRTKRFDKPLFPGYVFGRLPNDRSLPGPLLQYLVRIIMVEDQRKFLSQLQTIYRTLQAGFPVRLHPLIRKGTRVKVNAGPLRGVEGIVDDPANPKGVVVSVDFLQQGVLIKVPPESLKCLPA